MSETPRDIPIYIDVSEEISQILSHNRVGIEDILQREGIDVTVGFGVPPVVTEEGARSKELVPLILAGSALIPAIFFGLSQFLSTVYNRPYFIEYYEHVELRDSQGEVVTDIYGKPLFKQVKRFALVTPSQKAELEAQFNVENGVMLKIGVGQGQE
jgi:hypothetical protein